VRGTSDELLGDPRPSPDGTRLAYTRGLCLWFGTASYLRVRTLATGATIDIGRGADTCAGLGRPAWSADSKALVIGASPSPSKRSLTPGVCYEAPPPVLVVARIDHPEPFPGG